MTLIQEPRDKGGAIVIGLFGAGKIGRSVLSFFNQFGISIDFFVDNNLDICGEYINGVKVVSVDELACLPRDTDIFITCKDSDAIMNQLIDIGIMPNKIMKFDNYRSVYSFVLSVSTSRFSSEILQVKGSNDVVFALDHGMVIGGVETWCIQSVKLLDKLGYSAKLMVRSGVNKEREVDDVDVIWLDGINKMSLFDALEMVMTAIVESKCHTVVCNFIEIIFFAACAIKKWYNSELNIIAVVHSDDDVYLPYYTRFCDCIDTCFVISNKMIDKFEMNGFPKNKLVYLPWLITCDKEFSHIYSDRTQTLKIGYAGRIVVWPKRADLLVEIALKLRDLEVDFLMYIAGNGIYMDDLEKRIIKLGLKDWVKCIGIIENKYIRDFWVDKDIMIGCSEIEGHSMTQCEAMAAGAVPIVTDVSGARDDITEGYNGYVVDIGDIDAIVNKVHYLYKNREKISIMGRRAYETIKNNNSEERLTKLWNKYLN